MKCNNNLANFLVLFFFLLGLVGILNHEMWRDELQAWLIARDSLSIQELIANLKYEGHPALWYLLLYGLSRFTHNPIAMQIAHLVIATGAIYLFVNFCPFTRAQKILFTFSYFPFYEYSIISRNYTIGILLLFGFCAVYSQRNKSYLSLAVIIALLANTNIFSLIIALALTGTLVFEFFTEKIFFIKKAEIFFSIAIVAFGITIAIFQLAGFLEFMIEMKAVGDSERENIVTKSAMIEIDWRRARVAIASICKAYLPILNVFKYNFWTTNLLFDGSVLAQENVSLPIFLARIFSYVLSLFILGISLFMFASRPVAFFLYSSGTFGVLLFFYLTFMGYARHWGHLFILFIACLWLSKYVKKRSFLQNSLNRRINANNWLINFHRLYRSRFLTLLLSIHFVMGIYAYQRDLIHPFSVGKAASNYIKVHQLEQLDIVGKEAYKLTTIAGFIDKEIYYPETGEFGSFTRWNKLKWTSEAELLEAVASNFGQSKILLILTEELATQNSTLAVKKLVQFEGGIVGNENYYLYLVEKN